MPATLGSVTKHRFEHSPEAHKLHIEFEVAAATVIHEADPVKLTVLGTVELLANSDDAHLAIGVAMTEGAAGERHTVSMRGYTTVWGEAEAAAVVAGPVEMGSWNATTGRREYLAASAAGKCVGHALTPGAADGSEMLICLL